MSQNEHVTTTDSWPFGKILKHVLLPKPKGSPKAGKKEIGLRVGMAVFFGAVFLIIRSSSNGLPACDGSDTTSLVENIVGKMPLVQAARAQFVALKDISEQGYNKDSDVRVCSATLVTTAGEDGLQYFVRWQNPQEKTFYVEARIQN